jgi:hypothetical protein
MANRAAVLTFATAFAVLGALLAVASAISGAHPEPLRISTTAPVLAALALLAAATSARRRLRRLGREPG